MFLRGIEVKPKHDHQFSYHTTEAGFVVQGNQTKEPIRLHLSITRKRVQQDSQHFMMAQQTMTL